MHSSRANSLIEVWQGQYCLENCIPKAALNLSVALPCLNIPDTMASVQAVLQLESHLIYLLYSFHPSTSCHLHSSLPSLAFHLVTCSQTAVPVAGTGQWAHPPLGDCCHFSHLLTNHAALAKFLMVASILAKATVFWSAEMLLQNSMKMRHSTNDGVVLWMRLI